MGHPGIHLRNIFQAELAHIRLKHRKCSGWMFIPNDFDVDLVHFQWPVKLKIQHWIISED